MQAPSTVLLIVSSSLALLSPQGTAQGVTPLGTGIAQGISADGTTVVGDSGPSGAWAWTATGGQVGLGGLAALGVSGDGSVVFGSDGSSPTTAAVWKAATGWQSIGGLPGSGGCPDLSNPYNISDGGDVATGLGWDNCSAFAFRWTPATGFEQLPQLGPFSSRGNDVSGDGTHVGGWDEAPNGSRRAAIWFPGGTEQLILEDPLNNPDGAGEVWGFSTDGTYACGSGPSSLGAFRWSAANGYEYLGTIPGFSGATAMAISDDGKVAVGFAGSAFFGLTGFIWTEWNGMQRMSEYAATELGFSLPSGQDFQVMADMTPDGRKVVGYVAANAGPFSVKTAVRIDLPTPCGASTYGVGVSPANTLDLALGSTTSSGSFTNYLLTTSGVPTNQLVFTYGSLQSAQVPALGGVALINAAQIVAPFVAFSAAGIGLADVMVPNNPFLDNLTIYFQSATQDASLPLGWALSNGLALKICL